MERLVLTVVAVLLAAAPARQKGQTQPTTTPATCATTATAVDPAAKKLLDQLEAAGEKHATLRAEIDYHVEMPTTGDSERRTGWVAYQKQTDKTPAKFRIHFDTLRMGEGRKIRAKVDYAFDGAWLTVAKHRIKNMTRYQVVAEGRKIQPLRLGKGPFPVPFGQKAEDVLKYFEVSTRPANKDDPADTNYLELQTRRRFRKEISFRTLRMWIARKTHLPVKAVSVDGKKNVTTVIFENTRTGVKFDDKMFHLPRKAGWQYSVEPLDRPARATK